MTKHRRNTHYRKITIAAVAVAAVGIPSVAMACLDDQGGKGDSYGHHASKKDWRDASQKDWRAQNGRGAKAPADPVAPSASGSPSATPSTPTSGTTTLTAAQKRVVELVNAERAKAGCSALTVNAKLTQAAQAHSKDMAAHQNMSHTGSDGSNPGQRITRAGYNWSTYGENVAYGYSTPEKVMQGWMSSAGHKRNILNCSFKEIGVGLAQPGNYWTQNFGTAR
ncbi:CAP domain-containing protein [Streptomyces sp. SAJ15]|uniref:CAP domain-containing protein n=1 Tax=Streptomyces sp. SAJ15 TaxID=2011095 RepID=UPI0011872E86|nr:CAP domain-containing protein [Streptomyces sp. SAJ15]TVL92236.1 hypothetical protein CD790_10960 [Streptomyces sp. SAJ15]